MTTAPIRPTPATHTWNTLQLLRAARIAILAADTLLLIAVLIGAHVHYDAMRVVGKSTVPSIIDAQAIKAALADMDANLANDLLLPAGTTSSASKLFDQRREDASTALIKAAENVTFGEKEEAPINRLQVESGTYEREAQQARDAEGDHQAEKVIADYRNAALTMDQTLLPAADALDKANNDELERTYSNQKLHSFGSRTFLTLAGLFALAALVVTQMYLSQHMRRTLNPMLLLATLLTLWLTVYAFASMGREEQDLKLAREDAFTSVHALWQARALAFEANADESRYLLDPQQAAGYEHDFLRQTDKLAHIPLGTPPSQIITAAASGRLMPGFKGYLADELENITFPGEREAAVATLAAFERYMTIDAEIRRLEQSGQRQKAIALCTGAKEGESDWAFDQFNDALGRTLAINEKEFDQAVDEGLAAVAHLDVMAAIAAVLIAILTFFGLKPRIREYE